MQFNLTSRTVWQRCCYLIFFVKTRKLLPVSKMTSYWPETPLTSRCGSVRGRKSIRKHPISELRECTDLQVTIYEEGSAGKPRTSVRMAELLAEQKDASLRRNQ